MRTRSILRIGVAVSATIYSVSSANNAVGRRRNRGVLRDNNALPESSNIGPGGEHENHARSLGVGLENLKYETAKVQHYKESKSKGKTKGGEKYSVTASREEVGKGAGKGYGSKGTDNQSKSKSSGLSTKSTKPKYQRKEYKSAKARSQTKLTKSGKGSPTFQPTSQPTNKASGEDITGLLSPYTIQYTVTDDNRPPFRSELLEVVELTRTYLDNFFLSNYKNTELSSLSKVMTLFTSTAFEFGEPIPVDYESKAIFDASSILIPDKEDLDNILASAFEGDNLDGYIGLLQSLPPSNIFSSTQFAKLTQTTEESPSLRFEAASENTFARNVTLGSIVAGGVAGLLLISFATRRTRRKRERNGFSKSSTSITGESFTTQSSRLDDRMCRPISDELYYDHAESRR